MSVPRIIVRDLGKYGNKEELRRVYSRFGPLRNIWVANDPPGFAYVFFEDSKDALRAVTATNGNIVCGGHVRVEYSPTEDKKAFSQRIRHSPIRERGPPLSRDAHSPRRERGPPFPRSGRSPPRDRGPPFSRGHESRNNYHSHEMPPRGGRNFSHHARSPSPPPPPPREREDRYSNHHMPRSGGYPSNRRQEHHTRGSPPPSHREQGRVLTHTGNRLNPRRRHSGEYPRDRGGHPNHSKSSLSSSLHEGYVVDRYVPKPSRNERQHPSSHPRSGHSPRYHQRPPSREQMHSSRDHFGTKGHYSPVNSYSRPLPPPSLASHNRSRENDMHYRDQRSHVRHHNHREHQNRPHTHSSSTMRSKHQYRSKDVRSLPKQTIQRRPRDPVFEEQRDVHRQRHDETEIHLSPDTHHRSRSPYDSPPQDAKNNVDISPQEPKGYLDDEPQYQTRSPSPSVEVEVMDKEREGTPYEEKEYSHLRHSNSPPTNYIEGNVAEFATNDAFSDEAFNEEPYADIPNTEYDYFNQQEPENYPTESQFLEIDEVKDESREEEYLEPAEPVTSAPYYQEREVVYSPPPLEREVIHVTNEREVIVSRSPSNRQRLVIAK